MYTWSLCELKSLSLDLEDNLVLSIFDFFFTSDYGVRSDDTVDPKMGEDHL
jgi:hypothetical protein